MPNPTITNVSVVSRFKEFALASGVVIDGANFASDTTLVKGQMLFKQANGKWRKFVPGTDVLVAGSIRILKEEIKVNALVDAFASAWFEGFFALSTLQDINSGLLASHLTSAGGFLAIESDEYRLK
jgi:hypothetical protein